MARHYSSKYFFRQMPNALLARYFQGRELFGDLDFTDMKEGKPVSSCLLLKCYRHYPVIMNGR